MTKSTTKGQEIIQRLKDGQPLNEIKTVVAVSEDEWHKFSSKAYSIALTESKKERVSFRTKKHVSATSNEEILAILELNEQLADYALLLPIMSTMNDFKAIQPLALNLPSSENRIIQLIGLATMHPRLRVMQKKREI